MRPSHILLLVLSIYWVTGDGNVENIDLDEGTLVKVIAGSFVRKIDNVLLYTSTAPLIYEITFDFSKLIKSKYKIPKCENSDSINHCKLIKNAGYFIKSIEDRLELIRESVQIKPYDSYYERREKRNIIVDGIRDGIGSAFSFCCSLVTKSDLDSIFTTQSNMKEVLKKMKSSIITDHSNVMILRNGFKNFTSNVQDAFHHYDEKLRNLTRLIDKTEKEDNNKWVEYISFINAMGLFVFQILQSQNRVAELIQYQDILSHCRSHFIPFTAIKPNELQADLEKIQEEVSLHGYTTAIKPRDVMSMYNYPLAKCHFSGDKINIHVRVPLKQKEAKITLYEVVNLPFLFRDSVCSINHSPTYVAETDNSLVTIQGTQLNSCDPASGICYISQFTEDPQIGKQCVEHILQGSSVSDLKKNCPFTCNPRNKNSHFITQLDFHTFMIAGASEGSKIECTNNNGTITSQPLPIIEVGSLEIKIPCQCKILIQGRSDFLTSPFPCPKGKIETVSITHTIPSPWSKVDVIITNSKLQEELKPTVNAFRNLSVALNESWTLEPTTLNISDIADLVHVKIPDIIHKLPSISSALLFIWNIPLTIAVIYLFWDRIKKAAQFAAR